MIFLNSNKVEIWLKRISPSNTYLEIIFIMKNLWINYGKLQIINKLRDIINRNLVFFLKILFIFLNIKKNNFNPKQMLRVYKGIIDIYI